MTEMDRVHAEDESTATPHRDRSTHFRRLEALHRRGELRPGMFAHLSVCAGSAELTIEHEDESPWRAWHHDIVLHALTEVARYACNSHEQAMWMAPTDFSIRFLRAPTGQRLHAHALVVHRMTWQSIAQAELTDQHGRLVATGSGAFGRSGWLLDDPDAPV